MMARLRWTRTLLLPALLVGGSGACGDDAPAADGPMLEPPPRMFPPPSRFDASGLADVDAAVTPLDAGVTPAGDDDAGGSEDDAGGASPEPVCEDPDQDRDGDGVGDCEDACPDDPNKTRRGKCGCGAFDTDVDWDGVLDCDDACPENPDVQKDPDGCGCGVPEDTDGDGTPDCRDRCPEDPHRVALGACGCVGEPDPAPATEACDDGVCPLSTTCDGLGRCGSAADCTPPAGCDAGVVHGGHLYFHCSTPRTWADARVHCMGAGYDLARVDDAAENDFLVGLHANGAWIGASDQVSEGVWVWPDGDQLWSGDATGSRTRADGSGCTNPTAAVCLYANWNAGEPNGGAGESCAIQHGTGHASPGTWNDAACDGTHPHLCEAW